MPQKRLDLGGNMAGAGDYLLKILEPEKSGEFPAAETR
jgi:hypothetical protein